jgi:hypothetical protein
VLSAIDDNLFREIISDPVWHNVVPALQAASRDPEFSAVNSLITELIERQTLCPSVHDILINLILGNVRTIAYLARFVGRLREVSPLTIADMKRIHDGIRLALGQCTDKERQAVLGTLLPIGTEFLRDHKIVDLALDCAQVIFVICRPMSDFRLPVVNYAVAVATHNERCLTELNAAIDKQFEECSRKLSVAPSIVLASKLAFIPSSSEAVVCDRLIQIFAKYQPESVGSDVMIGDMFVTVRQWMVNAAGEFRACATRFALEIFPQTMLTCDVEKAFFVDVFRKMSSLEMEGLITRTCQSCTRCPKKTQNSQKILFAAKRAAFLVSDVWPEKKGDIVGQIPTEVLMTYPKHQRDWKQAVAVLWKRT